MKTLVLNSGSSSIKYRLFDMADRSVLSSGTLEQIGEEESHLRWEMKRSGGEAVKHEKKLGVANHREGLEQIVSLLAESRLLSDEQELFGIGHRVVHGGESFTEPTELSAAVVEEIRRQSSLAPLHNPANLVGIEVSMSVFPDVPQVAVFDTAFHQTLPKSAFLYPLPLALYEEYRVRRYGFHGTSHGYVAKEVSRHLQRPLGEIHVIVLHLGNGASAAAIAGGRSVDTSMGLTPLEGLMMGTRSGDIDPAVIFHLQRTTGESSDDIEAMLNRDSGLKGICGVNDMREVYERAQQGDEHGQLAIDMYCYRVKKYIGAYMAALGRVDAVAFTAGIGENAWYVRQLSCQGLEAFGIEVDDSKNQSKDQGVRDISVADSKVRVLVVPTDEELEIADQTIEKIRA